MRRLALPVVLVALLAVSGSAVAAEIGSSHAGAALQVGCGTGAECIFTQDTLLGDAENNVVPSAGSITAFRVKGAEGNFRFVVLRAVNGSVTVATQSLVIAGQGPGSDVRYTFDTPLAVRAGDVIAIQLSSTGSVAVRDASGETGTNLIQFSADDAFTIEDEVPYELFLSATFQPAGAPPTNPGTPPANTVPTRVDPLSPLRAGKRPKVTIAGTAVTVSRKRVASILVTNSNGYAVRGALSLRAGKLKLGKGKVSLAAGAKKTIKVKLSKNAMKALRRRGKVRATAAAKLKGPIGRAGVTRKKLTVRAPKRKKKARRPSGGGRTPAAGNRWVARKTSQGGAYDDFEFTLNGDTITLSKPTLIFVSCFEMGGSFRSAFSYELFTALGPWKLGNQDATQQKQSVAVNQLITSGERTITFKMTSTRSGNRITGKRTMSFSGSRYNIFTNEITFINCSGTENYEAIPG